MQIFSPATFRQKDNEDGSWYTICMKCFLTVATAAKEGDLTKAEQCHNCRELWASKTGCPSHRGVTRGSRF